MRRDGGRIKNKSKLFRLLLDASIPALVFCSQVSYLGVDTLMLQRPPLVKDKYFDDEDLVLPYTEAAAIHKKRTFRGSVHYMQ